MFFRNGYRKGPQLTLYVEYVLLIFFVIQVPVGRAAKMVGISWAAAKNRYGFLQHALLWWFEKKQKDQLPLGWEMRERQACKRTRRF